jgi:hypothetical protein
MEDPIDKADSAPGSQRQGGERIAELAAATVAYIKTHPMWRWGLLGGAAGAVLNLLQIVATLATPKSTSLGSIFFAASIAVYGAAGYFVAREMNRQAPGALTGLIAGAVAGLVTLIVELVLILRGATLLIPGSGRVSFGGAALFLLQRVVLFTAAVGALGGAVGAIFGRNSRRN